MKADVCLLLEGTYPYVAGGVSTWVDQMIRANAHLRFAIVNLAANEQSIGEFKYTLPDNVVTLRTAFLHDTQLASRGHPYTARHTWRAIRDFYRALPHADLGRLEAMVRELARDDWRIHTQSLIFSRETWDLLLELYGKRGVSFIDFFWTWRFTHLPLLSLLNVELPPAMVYHCASTGYAGLLGCIAKMRHGGRLLLTEHGIYARERKIEIGNSNWVYDERREQYHATRNMGFFRQWWIDMFMVLSQLAYQAADRVTTLFQGNFDQQVKDGCPPEKLSIIPNGIDIENYSGVFEEHERFLQNEDPERPFIVGFVGRVAPIKDVKTFIKAIKIAADRLPRLRARILGPLEEDPAYVEECRLLIELLGLGSIIDLAGRVNMKQHYAKLDIVVLTSVSEGLPFVVLEAAAAGIPCVCTDVGACRELLEGRDIEDRLIGGSGFITRIASPDDTAAAILRLAREPELYRQFSQHGLARMHRFYKLDDVLARYTAHYHDLMRL